MIEEEPEAIRMNGKEYVVPEDLVKALPTLYANHVQLSITSDGIGMMFCTKMDTLGQAFENNIAVPQATLFVSLAQAKSLGTVLLKNVELLENALRKESESEEKANVR